MAARYYQELLKFCARRVNDPDLAADLVQEIMARVIALQQSGTPITDLRGLLYRTARNILIDHYRQREVRDHVDADVLLEMHAPALDQPEEQAEANQRVDILLDAIDALPPRCREAFILHKFDGLSHAEVAAQMGISRNMVERHVMLAVAACRRARSQATSTVAAPPVSRMGRAPAETPPAVATGSIADATH